ncbi:hypothetical protein WJ048_03995 [Listeria welshimeri]|uniref:Putative secreted protein n=1 Tax=Listeria welshimeri serovar 6b (strain ATCC 35897 / DSM 20650 / CCUG 15529 / CIP 8149 / NCTC 11857 / SLCC 5334 / V8) TaxID=386043 RepID=A0AGS0_LISW6|nr:hypothetical protein [Listeria welshimeri]CAK20202.1 putative secreted protein [Listeria welshimeri serovar 6b str. SLCC5334]SNV21236.1 Uncharacterised protein [Listeria welshimeri]
MKKKWFSYISVMLLVSPSLIGTGQVFADTIELEQTDESKKTMADETEPLLVPPAIEQQEETSDSETNTNETENNDSTKSSEDSLEEMNKEETIATVEGHQTRESSTDTNDDIASGTFGSAPWRIDQSGTLHIESGVFDYHGSTYPSPWIGWSSDIQKIIFDGKVSTSFGASRLFADLTQVKTIENLSNLDTSNATTMS